MHRQRTRFSRRVNPNSRIAPTASQGGRAPRRPRDVPAARSRCSRTEGAARLFGSRRRSSTTCSGRILADVREDGYAELPFGQLVPDEAEWRADGGQRDRSSPRPKQRLPRAAGTSARAREGVRDPLQSYGVELGLDDPWFRPGVSHRVLDVANTYLGMWSKLEYVDVWYTPPAADAERKSSQRWHRDFNDRHLLKAFLYLWTSTRRRGRSSTCPAASPAGELGAWAW